MKRAISEWLARLSPMDAFAITASTLTAAGTVLVWVFWFGSAVAEANTRNNNQDEKIQAAQMAIASLQEKREADKREVMSEIRAVNDNLIRLMIAQGVKPKDD